MPLAAALFGTMKWQPQWLHHNFLPVIGLRVHAKVPPSPLTDGHLVALLGLWERKRIEDSSVGPFYRQYSSTLVFRPHSQQWAHGRRKSRLHLDIVHCAQQMYTGTASSDSQAMLDRSRKWAQWVFFTGGTLARRLPMQDRPLMLHCSGLGGGLPQS